MHPDDFVQGKSRGRPDDWNRVRTSDLCLQVGEPTVSFTAASACRIVILQRMGSMIQFK